MTAPAFRSARFWGQLLRRDVVFEIVHAEGTAPALVREGRKEKGEGEREQWLVRKRKREGAPGSKTGLPLKHCSLSFASLRELTFSSPCLSLLPAPSSLAAWP